MIIYDVCIIWISTYNFECLTHSLTEFERQVDPRVVSYFHYIVDSSLGKQDILKQWLQKRKQLENKILHLPPVECFFCDSHLAVTSKKNIAFSHIKNRCRFIIEFEDDVTVHSYDSNWLKNAVTQITEKENSGVHLYWNLNYGSDYPYKNAFVCAAAMGSVSTFKMLYPLPSQITGEFINSVQEMMDFPNEVQKKIHRLNLSYEGSEDTYLEYDIATQSTNYASFARDEFDKMIEKAKIKYKHEFDFSNKNKRQIFDLLLGNKIITKEAQKRVFIELFEQFQQCPLRIYPIIQDTQYTEETLANRVLLLKKTKHFSVPLVDYKTLRTSICLTKEEFNNLMISIDNADQRDLIIGLTVNICGVYAISVVKQEFEQVKKDKNLLNKLLKFIDINYQYQAIPHPNGYLE